MRDITKFTNLTNKEVEDLLATFTIRIVNMEELSKDEQKDLHELTIEAQQRGLI